MFSCVFDKVDGFRDALSTIVEFVDDVKLKFGKEGIFLDAADRAVVVISSLKVYLDSFEEYNFEKEKKIGINLTNFLNVLKRVKPAEKLKLFVPDEGNKLMLEIRGKSVRKFMLPLIDVSSEELPDISTLKFACSFEIPTEILDNMINDAELFTDFIIFRVNGNKVMVATQSDYGSFEIELGEKEISKIKAEESVKARYSLDYLKKIIKAKKISEAVKVALGTDYPIKFIFEDPGMLSLSFILAPRVEES